MIFIVFDIVEVYVKILFGYVVFEFVVFFWNEIWSNDIILRFWLMLLVVFYFFFLFEII